MCTENLTVEQCMSFFPFILLFHFINYFSCSKYRFSISDPPPPQLIRKFRYFRQQVEAAKAKLQGEFSNANIIRMAVAYRLVNKHETFKAFGGMRVPYLFFPFAHFLDYFNFVCTKVFLVLTRNSLHS